MKKNIALFIVMLLCSVQVRCVPPLGSMVVSPADGHFSKKEKESLAKHYKNETMVRHEGVGYDALRAYANDMHVFIKRHLWKDWVGVVGLYLNVANNKTDLHKAWWHCTRWSKQAMGNAIGFYCPYNGEVTVYTAKFPKAVMVYDHEEGHYQNDLDGDSCEFPSEYNAMWKDMLRFALHQKTDISFSLYASPPHDKKTLSIKVIGRYRAARLMFLFVANHLNGDLTKGAKFVFRAKEKLQLKFFYSKIKEYKGKYTLGQIWTKEVAKFFGSKGLRTYIDSVRKEHAKWTRASL